MYIFEELKINKFKKVRIPSKGELFNSGRFVHENGTYGGEDADAINAAGTNKIDDTEALMIELDRQQGNQE